MNNTRVVKYKQVPGNSTSPSKQSGYPDNYLRAHRQIDPLKTDCIAHKALTFVGKFFIYVIFLPYGFYKAVQWFRENQHSAELRVKKYTAALDELSDKLPPSARSQISELSATRPFTSLETKTKKVIDILENRKKFKNDRQAHNALIKALRDALTSKEYQQTKPVAENSNVRRCQSILRAICYVRYTQVHLKEHIQDVFTTLLPEDKRTAPSTMDETAKAIFKDSRTINQSHLCNRKFDKLNQRFRGHYNINFNASGTLNVPYVRSHLTLDRREIVQLRHGSPTREMGIFNAILVYFSRIFRGNFHNAEMVVEYVGFLDYLEHEIPRQNAKDLPEQVLYVNHQKTTSPTICFGGDESERVHVLQNFKHPTFNYLSLPVGDKAIFKLNREFAKAQSTADYKSLLMDAIRHDRYGIKIPDSLKTSPLFIERLGVLFDEVHEAYFANQANTFDQRTVLTLIFFAYLQLIVMQRLNIKYVVNSCKDNIDRGNTFTAILELINTISQGHEPNEEELQRLRVHMIAAPYLVRKTGVLSKRSIYLEMVLKHLSTLTNNQRTAIRGRKDSMISLAYFSPASSQEEYTHLLREIFEQEKLHPTQMRIDEEYHEIIQQKKNSDGSFNKEKIFHEVSIEFNRMGVVVDGTRYKTNNPLENDEKLNKLFDYLREKIEDENKTLEYMCFIGQVCIASASKKIFQTFVRPDLDIHPRQSPQKLNLCNSCIIANTSSKVPTIASFQRYSITNVDEDKEVATMTLKTHIDFSAPPKMYYSWTPGHEDFNSSVPTQFIAVQ